QIALVRKRKRFAAKYLTEAIHPTFRPHGIEAAADDLRRGTHPTYNLLGARQLSVGTRLVHNDPKNPKIQVRVRMDVGYRAPQVFSTCDASDMAVRHVGELEGLGCGRKYCQQHQRFPKRQWF